jgi:hypothetical protein
MGWLLLILAIGSGGTAELPDRVAMIELNHYYKDGARQFDQLIFYEFDRVTCKHVVRFWKIVEPANLHDYPAPVRGTADHSVRLKDGNGYWRNVRSSLYRETWTTYDPERENKQLVEERHRVGLLPRINK